VNTEPPRVGSPPPPPPARTDGLQIRTVNAKYRLPVAECLGRGLKGLVGTVGRYWCYRERQNTCNIVRRRAPFRIASTPLHPPAPLDGLVWTSISARPWQVIHSASKCAYVLRRVALMRTVAMPRLYQVPFPDRKQPNHQLQRTVHLHWPYHEHRYCGPRKTGSRLSTWSGAALLWTLRLLRMYTRQLTIMLR
jgi:hypothetical protein